MSLERGLRVKRESKVTIWDKMQLVMVVVVEVVEEGSSELVVVVVVVVVVAVRWSSISR